MLNCIRGIGPSDACFTAIFRIYMVEAYGGGSNEADFTAFQQFLVAAGAGTYNQCIGIFYQLRSEVSAGSINHAVGYFSMASLMKGILLSTMTLIMLLFFSTIFHRAKIRLIRQSG